MIINEVAEIVSISYGSAHHIISEVLQFHKVSARWVPRQLTHIIKIFMLMLAELYFNRM